MADLLNLPSPNMSESEMNQYLMQTVIKLNQIIEQINSEMQDLRTKGVAKYGKR